MLRLGDGASATVAVIVRTFAHPSLDAMIAELQSSVAALSLTPLGLFRGHAASEWPATLAIAGRGEDERGTRGMLRVAVEEVTELHEDSLVVHGGTVSGACRGDSGGPALAWTDGGRPQVAGVLSYGSADCTGLDVYIRADKLASWVASTIASVATDRCGDIPVTGVCTPAGPRWCEEETLRGEACLDKTTCGFDRTRGRYGCVDGEADPCLGLSDEWTCLGYSLARCRSGTLDTLGCSACGMTCKLTPRGARCVPQNDGQAPAVRR